MAIVILTLCVKPLWLFWRIVSSHKPRTETLNALSSFHPLFLLLFVQRIREKEREREKGRKGGIRETRLRESSTGDSFTVCCCSLHNLPSSRLLFFFFAAAHTEMLSTLSSLFSLGTLRSHAHAPPVARLVYVVQKAKKSFLLFFFFFVPLRAARFDSRGLRRRHNPATKPISVIK